MDFAVDLPRIVKKWNLQWKSTKFPHENDHAAVRICLCTLFFFISVWMRFENLCRILYCQLPWICDENLWQFHQVWTWPNTSFFFFFFSLLILAIKTHQNCTMWTWSYCIPEVPQLFAPCKLHSVLSNTHSRSHIIVLTPFSYFYYHSDIRRSLGGFHISITFLVQMTGLLRAPGARALCPCTWYVLTSLPHT